MGLPHAAALLRFGHAGRPVLAFPTELDRARRYRGYEHWLAHVIAHCVHARTPANLIAVRASAPTTRCSWG